LPAITPALKHCAAGGKAAPNQTLSFPSADLSRAGLKQESRTIRALAGNTPDTSVQAAHLQNSGRIASSDKPAGAWHPCGFTLPARLPAALRGFTPAMPLEGLARCAHQAGRTEEGYSFKYTLQIFDFIDLKTYKDTKGDRARA
jgi:hypothetical protein